MADLKAESCASVVVDVGLRLHRALGPGLLESVYEAVMERELQQRGLRVRRQCSLPFEFDGMYFEDGLRVDLLVGDCLVVELKSVDRVAPVHVKQVLTYLQLLDLRLGLLLNFGEETFQRGCRRVVAQGRRWKLEHPAQSEEASHEDHEGRKEG